MDNQKNIEIKNPRFDIENQENIGLKKSILILRASKIKNLEELNSSILKENNHLKQLNVKLFLKIKEFEKSEKNWKNLEEEIITENEDLRGKIFTLKNQNKFSIDKLIIIILSICILLNYYQIFVISKVAKKINIMIERKNPL
jgi:hypothetical protein